MVGLGATVVVVVLEVVVGATVVVVELEVVVGATVVVVGLGGLGWLRGLGGLRACRRQDQRYSDRCGNEREDDDSEAHAGSFYRLHSDCLDQKRINGRRPP
jgi:hypothetical protein